jgi:hypothetical protein
MHVSDGGCIFLFSKVLAFVACMLLEEKFKSRFILSGGEQCLEFP